MGDKNENDNPFPVVENWKRSPFTYVYTQDRTFTRRIDAVNAFIGLLFPFMEGEIQSSHLFHNRPQLTHQQRMDYNHQETKDKMVLPFTG